jgi:lipopolysaccharide biosynthesis glycosyltransferase
MRGVVYVTVGKNALAEARKSSESLVKYNDLPFEFLEADATRPVFKLADQQAHWLKVNMDALTPFEPTLMLDADTRIKGDLSLGFEILKDGWDLVMVPSMPGRFGEVLWNLTSVERQVTLDEIGQWAHVMFNTGLMYFKNSGAVHHLFETWQVEWLRFKDRDQGAFLRALRRCPVKLWLLGYPYNCAGGEVVDHLFGRARE